jgi:branched-chain amino acid transport system substrate-binding protein
MHAHFIESKKGDTMKILKRTLVCIAAAGLVGLQAHAAEPIRLGMSAPFTGGSGPLGTTIRDAARQAVAEINAAGGVLGRPLELVERDDESRNERGVQIAQELVHREKIVAGVGVINSGVGLASVRIYQQARIPLVSPGPTATAFRDFMPPKQPASFFFRMSLPDDVQARRMVEDAVVRSGFQRVAVLADSTNYGQLGKQDVIGALAAKSVTPVTVDKFNIGDVDMTPQLLRAKEAGAQALLVYGVGPELAQLANGMVRLGWKVPMIGSWTLSMPNFIENAGAAGNGARMPLTFDAEGTTGTRKAFVDKMAKLYPNGKIPAPSWAAQAYDGVNLVAMAIRQAGSTDGDKIRLALEDLKRPFLGMVQTYDKPFSASSHEAFAVEGIGFMGTVRDGLAVRADTKPVAAVTAVK